MRAKWIKEGDANTKIFRNMTDYYKKINYIEVMKIDDRVATDSESLRQGVKDFFGRLYYEEFDWRPRLEGLNFNSLDGGSRDYLERVFMEEEIYED